MLDPIVKTIEVPCSRQKAFDIFVSDMGSWWPLAKRSVSMMSGEPARALRVDARLNGKIVETAADGSEHLWGTITDYDPHHSVGMTFHLGLPPESAGKVEVEFTSLAPQRTRVVLTQSHWEGYGPLAARMRDGYGSGWVLIFEEAFKAACE